MVCSRCLISIYGGNEGRRKRKGVWKMSVGEQDVCIQGRTFPSVYCLKSLKNCSKFQSVCLRKHQYIRRVIFFSPKGKKAIKSQCVLLDYLADLD